MNDNIYLYINPLSFLVMLI